MYGRYRWFRVSVLTLGQRRLKRLRRTRARRRGCVFRDCNARANCTSNKYRGRCHYQSETTNRCPEHDLFPCVDGRSNSSGGIVICLAQIDQGSWRLCSTKLRVREGSFRGPKGTTLLTPRGLLIRESESFGANFRGPKGTVTVPLAPRLISLKTERGPPRRSSSQILL